MLIEVDCDVCRGDTGIEVTAATDNDYDNSRQRYLSLGGRRGQDSV